MSRMLGIGKIKPRCNPYREEGIVKGLLGDETECDAHAVKNATEQEKDSTTKRVRVDLSSYPQNTIFVLHAMPS